MEVKGEELLFLFGAGASYEAGIPISYQMVQEVEKLIVTHEDWKPYKDLYHYLKSSINYSDGILGKFNETFNVERLLVVISEIEKRDRNIMYPFIGAWNTRLLDLAGPSFSNITGLQKLIRKQLNTWVRLKNYENANYYEAFASLSSEIGSLIKVFTLNYDLCFERIVGRTKNIQLGFSKISKDWHYWNFEVEENQHYLLYKLHGSIDWYSVEDEPGKLYLSDDPVENPELIFGIQHKMTSVDPYFYYSSKLRETCFNDAKLIVVIGYSFSDDYLNIILSQGLISKPELRIISVGPVKDTALEKKRIETNLNLHTDDQIIIANYCAKEFMTQIMNKDYLASNMAKATDVPF